MKDKPRFMQTQAKLPNTRTHVTRMSPRCGYLQEPALTLQASKSKRPRVCETGSVIADGTIAKFDIDFVLALNTEKYPRRSQLWQR